MHRLGLSDLPAIAAVRDPNGAGFDKTEMWRLCASEKQVLERSDEDVLWVTDEDALADVLHQRTGGSDLHTFVEKDPHEMAVFVNTVPRWLGPLDVKLLRKFLEKHPSVCLPVPESTRHENWATKNWATVRQFVTKLKKLPFWENYESRVYGNNIYLDYSPGAGTKRREIKAAYAANTRRYKQERQAAKKATYRHNVSIPAKDLGRLSVALRHELCQLLPKKVGAALPVLNRGTRAGIPSAYLFDHISKSKIIEHIILCGGLLRVLDNPHHQKLSPPLRKALEKLTPHIKELESKVLPFSDLGRYLSEEVALLAKEGYSLET